MSNINPYGVDFQAFTERQAVSWACGTIQKFAPWFRVESVEGGWTLFWIGHDHDQWDGGVLDLAGLVKVAKSIIDAWNSVS